MSILETITNEANTAEKPVDVAPEQPAENTAETENLESTENQNASTENADSPERKPKIEITTETPDAPEPAKTETPATENPFANEEVAKYNDFVKRTGKSYDDYKALNTPTDEIDPKELLRKYYSEKEGMSEKEIAYEMTKFELAAETDDDDDDFKEDATPEQLKAQAEIERDLRKAREWREEDVKTQLSASETPQNDSADQQPTVEQFLQTYEEQQRQSVNEYREKMYEALPEIKGIELDILGQKISYTPDEDFTRNMRLVSEDLSVGMNSFFENGKVTKPKELAAEAVWAYKPTRDAMLKFMIDQAITIDRATNIKERRNVSASTYQNLATSGDIDGEASFDKFREERKN